MYLFSRNLSNVNSFNVSTNKYGRQLVLYLYCYIGVRISNDYCCTVVNSYDISTVSKFYNYVRTL